MAASSETRGPGRSICIVTDRHERACHSRCPWHVSDASLPPGPFLHSHQNNVTYTLGTDDIVTGLEDGLESMRSGEVALVKVQPRKAFGAAGRPELGVPPEAVVRCCMSALLRQRDRERELTCC